MMLMCNAIVIIKCDRRRRPGLSNALLDVEYDNKNKRRIASHIPTHNITHHVLVNSCSVGAGMRMPRQRDRRGSMTLDGELHSKMILHCDEYFSIVRLRPAWACLLSLSTSVNNTTLKLFDFPSAALTAECKELLLAISLITSWITKRSLFPTSLGLHSMW